MATEAVQRPTEPSKSRPTHIAYYTRPGKEGEKDFWNACGAAWAHKDGKGFRLRLDAVPVGGVIELRINEPKAANDAPTGMWDDAPDAEAY